MYLNMVALKTFLIMVCFYIGNGLDNLDTRTFSGNGESADFWNTQAKTNIKKKARARLNTNVAKNVILFLGDGMGISTITAARILKGQLAGKTGEETVMSFEKFPFTGFSKTYSQDYQVTDSAASATAIHCGVKANRGTLGLDARAWVGECSSQNGTELTSILDWSMKEGKSVGFVTTTKVTHATPASLYANVASRDWEGDDMTPAGCKDIAAQLIDDYKNITVIMGGGREHFMKHDQKDPESGSYGRRGDRDLIQEWKDGQHAMGRKYRYVWNQTDFNSVNPATTDSIMALFSSSHMSYELERKDRAYELAGEPSLQEMTRKAIRILRKNPKGYFLLVEGGRIDHAHHEGLAKLALHDTIAFQDAVAKGVRMTSESDTLLVATADHAHTLTIAGYPSRGNDILGKVDGTVASDNQPYTTLLYGNGPGYQANKGRREDISKVDTTHNHYVQQSAVYLSPGTHAGEDVAVYARGPMSHLFSGVHEQNEIAHAMAYASCVGEYTSTNDCARGLK